MVTEACAVGDLSAFGLDRLQVSQAEAMELVRIGAQRGPLESQGVVDPLAIRQRGQAGSLSRLRQDVPGRGEQAGVGRLDVLTNRGGDLGAIRRGRDGRRHDDGRRLGRLGDSPAELLRESLGDDARRQDALTPRLPDSVDVRVDERGVRGQAAQPALQPLRSVGALLLGRIGQRHRRPFHVIDGLEQRPSRSLDLDGRPAHEAEDVGRHTILVGQLGCCGARFGPPARRQLVELRERPGVEGAHRFAATRRGVLEPVVVAIVADRGGQPGLELEQALPVALGDLLGGAGSYPSGTSSSPGWVNAEPPAPANVIASR